MTTNATQLTIDLCAGGAILELRCGLGALALPVTLAALAVLLGERVG